MGFERGPARGFCGPFPYRKNSDPALDPLLSFLIKVLCEPHRELRRTRHPSCMEKVED